MAVWDSETTGFREPPAWLLTGHMLLWNDGSPAHVDMERFKAVDDGWEADLMISRSTLDGTKWCTMRMRLTPDVRSGWESQGTSARAKALQSLAIYLKLTEWYEADLGVLELR
jgi:hypothetical protein